MIPVEERNDITPICPHCNAPLTLVQCRLLSSAFGKRYPDLFTGRGGCRCKAWRVKLYS